MTYTYIFGIYVAYVLLLTKSILSCILLHGYCNYMGLPKFNLLFSKNLSLKEKIGNSK